jgi:CPA1 family monovalent cation:H+ antiporter
MFGSFTVILGLAALFGWINSRFIRLPSTIAYMILGLLLAVAAIISKDIVPGLYDFICNVVLHADFKTLVMDGMLSFLLFAGALHVDLKELARQKASVFLFATLGTVLSTALTGFALFGLVQLFGVDLRLIDCLLFGVLISPTDPIAVLSILNQIGVAKELRLKIEGESLFNDGIGVVVFTVLLAFAGFGSEHHGGTGSGEILTLLATETLGGIAFGLALGFVGFQMMRSAAGDAKTTTMLSVAIAALGYSTASSMGLSGPLAMVAAGLFIGNQIEHCKLGEKVREFHDDFWEMLDEMLNAVLFVFIGLVLHTVPARGDWILLSVILIPLVILARWISVGALFNISAFRESHRTKTIAVLTWGGLRGGISIALALSLEELIHDVMLTLTYSVIIFSILVQGLTIGPLLKRLGLSKA